MICKNCEHREVRSCKTRLYRFQPNGISYLICPIIGNSIELKEEQKEILYNINIESQQLKLAF